MPSGFEDCRGVYGEFPSPLPAEVTWDDPAVKLTTVQSESDKPPIGTFTVPDGAKDGPHTVTVTCTGVPAASATATFTVAPPTLTADPPSSAPGSTTTVSGAGFACPAGDTIALMWDTTTLPGPGKPNADGSFSAPVTVPPDAADGDHDLRASCASVAGITADTHLHVQAPAPTTPTPTPPGPSPVRTMTATPGAALHLSGPTNACPEGTGPRQVVFSWDNGPRSQPVAADGSGKFDATATIPSNAPTGSHRITVECADTHTVTETVPVLVARQVPPQPPKPDHLLWIVLGALAAAALAAFGLHRTLRTGGTSGTVTAEAGAWGDARAELTEQGGPAGPGRSVRLEPHPDPGRQSIEEVRDDDGRDG
ncbi:hypothetical protein ACIRYZ_07160 [Kitasatospora sp. NPDC101155]|uniref:hypothetical protein n=1 Tax=Kitasatospora sp. NPDC101155 TaxID=3364097 RepID=UPI003810BE68